MQNGGFIFFLKKKCMKLLYIIQDTPLTFTIKKDSVGLINDKITYGR